MKVRAKLSLLLAVAIMAAPVYSANMAECEAVCCAQPADACSTETVEVCAIFEAAPPNYQQAAVLQSASGNSIAPLENTGISIILPGNFQSFLAESVHSPPRITAPLTVPLLV